MSEMNQLYSSVVQSLEGSLLEESSLKLLSALSQSDDANFGSLLSLIKPEAIPVKAEKLLDVQSQSLRVLGLLSSSSNSCAKRLLQSGIPALILDHMKLLMRDEEAAANNQQIFEVALGFFADIAYDNILKDWIGENAFECLFQICAKPDYRAKGKYLKN